MNNRLDDYMSYMSYMSYMRNRKFWLVRLPEQLAQLTDSESNGLWISQIADAISFPQRRGRTLSFTLPQTIAERS